MKVLPKKIFKPLEKNETIIAEYNKLYAEYK